MPIIRRALVLTQAKNSAREWYLFHHCLMAFVAIRHFFSRGAREEAYAETDWSPYFGLPTFELSGRIVAYTYLVMERESPAK
jgi:hypothetical protein